MVENLLRTYVFDSDLLRQRNVLRCVESIIIIPSVIPTAIVDGIATAAVRIQAD